MVNHKIIYGDCLEVMNDIESKSIDMILCDLPYGTTTCSWDIIIPFEPLWKQYKRIIKDDGAILLTAGQPFTSILVTSNIEMFRYEWIWAKDVSSGFLNAKKMPLKEHENVMVFYKKLPTYNPQYLLPYNKEIIQAKRTNKSVYGNMGILKRIGMPYKQEWTNYPKTILKFSNEKGLHPTQKPVTLFEYLIKTYTNENDLVLDNCIGSGTTLIACENSNRNSIGIDISKEWCKVSYNRLNEMIQQIKLNEKKSSVEKIRF